MKASKRKGDVYIPNQPFRDWLRAEIIALGGNPEVGSKDTSGACEVLARRLDIASRTLYRHLRGLNGCSVPSDVIGRLAVEEMLHNAGASFYEIYPDFAYEQDIELEDDAWCRCCADLVTPIMAVCPWCDTPVDDLRMAA
jgi:hypothetical protein